jgi:hypothetical protein
MHPIPCSHCGSNFMRPTLDPDAPKLCNNCLVREEKRNPKKKEIMEKTIDIKIQCSVETYNRIEEYCVNRGMDMTEYFLLAHEQYQNICNNPDHIILASMNLVDNPISRAKEGLEEKQKEINSKSKKK